MTDGNTCTCRGYTAMHKPHPHADRDGSEARAQLEREHERALAAYVPEDKADEVERLRAEVADLRARVTRYERHAEADKTPCCLEYAEAAAMAVEQAADAGFMQAAADAWESSSRWNRQRAEKAEALLSAVDSLWNRWGSAKGEPRAWDLWLELGKVIGK